VRIPWWLWGLAGCVLVAGLIAPFASSLPDGLESTMERMSLSGPEAEPNAPLPDYETPGLHSERASMFLAAAVGIVVVFAATYLAGRLLSRRKDRAPTASDENDTDGPAGAS
jgi:hypothetical protein